MAPKESREDEEAEPATGSMVVDGEAEEDMVEVGKNEVDALSVIGGSSVVDVAVIAGDVVVDEEIEVEEEEKEVVVLDVLGMELVEVLAGIIVLTTVIVMGPVSCLRFRATARSAWSMRRLNFACIRLKERG
ncbi:hypothetical protein NLJ89_g983 [Agrocybe chaxingu]|uniref:Uncharacterized protein n=1 Tax=Agrocybe chaxingu TaxID=84603 RepID=A0A9W8N107_9AGAR|nr:hypothetical protein NLJ89_g983 [Agrocybe chaxingu]